MSKEQKAIKRLLSKPTDFEWSELERLLTAFGYEVKSKSGSSRKFIHPVTKAIFMAHEPHPSKVLKKYVLNAAIDFLRQEKHIP